MSNSQEPRNNDGQELAGVILTASKEPFKTANTAQAELTRKNLKDSHEVIPYGTGFAISPKGPKPENSGSDEDPENNDGSGQPPPAVKQPPKEKYFKVIFADKSSPNDTKDVVLSVNQEILHIQRGKEVVLPERYLECADHATYPQYRQEPNQPRKVVGHIMTYPYHKIGPGTEQEFLQMRRDGTLKNKREAMQADNAA